MTLRHITLSVSTAIATEAGDTTSTQNVLGKLVAILYKPGTIDTGATVTVTCEGPATFTYALVTVATAGTSDVLWYPRDIVHAVANGAALTQSGGGDGCMPLLAGNLKVAIASGGGTTVRTGSVVIYYKV